MRTHPENLEIEYGSESLIKHPGQLLKMMFRDLWQSRSLAFTLMKRDISVLYRQSFLGFTWAFIPSVLTAVTFSLASNNKILNIEQPEIPYAAYVLFSVALWQTFSESVLGPVNGVMAARSFITKINFPKEALFMAKFGEGVFNFLVKSTLVICVFVYYNISPSHGVVLALLLVLLMIVLGQTIGLLLAPINMIYQDVGKALPLILGLGMFVTPVVYPIPKTGTTLASIIEMNPLTYLISAIRDLAIYGYTDYSMEIMGILVVTIFLFVFAWIFFRLSMPYVIERCP